MGNFWTTNSIIVKLKRGIVLRNGEITEKFLTDNWKLLNDSRYGRKTMDNISENFLYYKISEEFLEKHLAGLWNWKLLSENYINIANFGRVEPTLSLSFIEKHPDMDYNWYIITGHPQMTEEFLRKFSEKPLDWTLLSNFSKVELTNEFVIGNVTKPWDWGMISATASLSLLEALNDNPLSKLDWKKISFVNSNLTNDFIHKYEKKIVFSYPIEKRPVEKVKEVTLIRVNDSGFSFGKLTVE